MEADERPSKLRKLSHDNESTEDDIPAQSATAASVPTEVGIANGISTESLNDNTVESTADSGSGAQNGMNDLPAPEDIAPLVSTAIAPPGDPPLSKTQQKKLRKQAEWDAKKEDRKVVRKEKAHARKERKREAKQEAIAAGTYEPRKQHHQPAVQLPVTFLVDCDFDDLMRDGERVSLASQVTRCYSDNKNARFRAHYTICSFNGKLRERFDTVLAFNYKSWRGVRTFETDFVETAKKAKEWMTGPEGGKLAGVFSKYTDLDGAAQQKMKDEAEVVYLTSEADEDLMELKPYSTYIIGGLVDKNREKGICYKRARRAGVKTAKLPIGEFMDMQSRKVLATNHVNEIMIRWLECGNWGEAFMKVIPKRKGGKLKGEKNEDGETPEADSDGEEGAAMDAPTENTCATHSPTAPIQDQQQPTTSI